MLGECHGRLMFINTLWNDNLCQGLVLLSLPSFRKRLNEELLLGVEGLGLIVRLFWWCPEVRRTQIVIEHEHQSKRFKPAVLWWSRSWEYIAKREQSWILIGSEWMWLGCELAVWQTAYLWVWCSNCMLVLGCSWKRCHSASRWCGVTPLSLGGYWGGSDVISAWFAVLKVLGGCSPSDCDCSERFERSES